MILGGQCPLCAEGVPVQSGRDGHYHYYHGIMWGCTRERCIVSGCIYCLNETREKLKEEMSNGSC